MSDLSVTIAICSYDRYAMLAKSVAAVVETTALSDRIELLVVENTPASKRQALNLPQHKHVRMIVCDDLGLAHARNAAIRNTTSDILIFLDDDAFVRPGWADAYLKAFSDVPQAKVVGGRCHALYELDPLPRWFDKTLNGYLSCIDWGDDPRFITPAEWVVGANVGFRRTVFDEFGIFDVTLGRKGASSLLSNEETALMDKIGRNHIFYEPKAAVDHFVPADRTSLTWFRKRVYWQAISDLLAGTMWITSSQASEEYENIVLQTEAEHRNLDLFSYQPRNFADFERQLRAIYLAAMAGSEGYKFASV
jgi:glucosyl-dolichyl phosphate glucuronosyltransferase